LDTCLGWDTVTCEEYEYDCGDGDVDFPEVCEIGELTDCVDIDPMKYKAGKAYCLDTCLGYDTATCEEIEEDDDTTYPDTADVQPDPDVVDDWIPDTTDVQPDPDTVDIDNAEADILPDVDTADADYFEDDVVPDNDSAGPCGSIRLDGSTGYVEVAHNALLDLAGNWTIEAWVNQDSDTDQAAIIRKGGTTSYPAYYLYGANYGVPYGGYYYSAGSFYSASGVTEPANGDWYHVALVKNGTALTIFVDGEPSAATTAASASYANSENLFFGSRRSSTPSYFDGLIDEIRISNVARYNSSFTPQQRFASDGNTIGLWHFEEGANNIAYNSAGDTLDGLLVGGVEWENACAAAGPIIQPDDDVVPDEDTAGAVIDTVGSTEPMTGGTSRMRGNFYSCDTDRTLTEIEVYLTYTGTPTIYFEVYESTTLDGTYYPLESVTATPSMSDGAFYSSGDLSVPLTAGNYYYVGVRWGSSYSVGYAADTAPAVGDYPTAFGTWEDGMLDDGVTSAPASFLYDDVSYGYAYYQRLTTQ
ncbi:MAG TPA: LamG domain-containing protein, partial [bacterium]|nr:LamG domain-containing protein [bacterium]